MMKKTSDRATGTNRKARAVKAWKARKNLVETFDNKYPDREYSITITNPEYTSVCPRTGLPDFGIITIIYIPDRKCLELKSLKYYFLEYRNEGIFYEEAVNRILDDLVASCSPRWMEIRGDFSERGGIHTTVESTYEMKE
jgi:7-cyano-7-deazaguanine reductase